MVSLSVLIRRPWQDNLTMDHFIHWLYSNIFSIPESMGLLGAGQAGGNTQNSPLMGSLREKGGQHPILEVYYFHGS